MYRKDFDGLLDGYTRMIYSVIRNINIEGFDKDDLFQELSMVLNECNITFDSTKQTKFSTFVFTRFRQRINQLLKYSTAQKRTKMALILDATVGTDDDMSLLNMLEDVQDSAENAQTTRLYEEILEELATYKHGNLTYLFYVEGKSKSEISELAGISKEGIRKINKKNIEKLRKRFHYYY